MNKLGQKNCPFLFIISYDLEKNYIIPFSELNPEFIQFDFSQSKPKNEKPIQLKPKAINYQDYLFGFEIVQKNLLDGNSFLTNLTVSTLLENTLSLTEVYEAAYAKYKLLIKEKLVCFSPETFVKVNSSGKISTFPMKGTINANVPNAKETLQNDLKEKNEHTTIVDLLRNDLSMVAEQIRVDKFQYIDKIKKSDGSEILQMSSEISGQLPKNWKSNLGDWFFKLLPAGSICGAPKAKTLEIIKEAEKSLHLNGERDFYTGIMGFFDGETLDSAVMIRFIEQINHSFFFKSGGGITHQSDAKKEYDEIYQKLYIPVK